MRTTKTAKQAAAEYLEANHYGFPYHALWESRRRNRVPEPLRQEFVNSQPAGAPAWHAATATEEGVQVLSSGGQVEIVPWIDLIDVSKGNDNPDPNGLPMPPLSVADLRNANRMFKEQGWPFCGPGEIKELMVPTELFRSAAIYGVGILFLSANGQMEVIPPENVIRIPPAEAQSQTGGVEP